MIAWGAIVGRFIGQHWRLFAGIALFALVAYQGTTIRSLRADLVTANAATKDAVAAGKQSEALRTKEQRQAVASYTAQQQRCDARITSARDAGAAIEEITHYGQAANTSTSTTPATGAGQDQHAAVLGHRAIVGADELRRVIGQAGKP